MNNQIYSIAVFGTGFKLHILKEENPFSNSYILCGKSGNFQFLKRYWLDSPKQNEDMKKYPRIKCQKCFKKLEGSIKNGHN